MTLKNKVAVIVGGGSGIGRATAMLLAERGVSVVVSDIVVANAQAVCQKISSLGGSFLPSARPIR